MKNLLIYTTPDKKFTQEDLILARIQVDNSIDLGWQTADIVLVTDFPFEYHGVKSLQVPEGLFYPFDKNANKIPVALYLIKQQLIDPEVLYWCHDFDAFENTPIVESELEMSQHNLGVVPYLYKKEWQFCSFFFRTSAEPLLKLIDQETRAQPFPSRNNEKNFVKLLKRGDISADSFKELNITYSIPKRYLTTMYNQATKPLRVLHFRPSDPKDDRMTDSALNMFMYGKSRLNFPLMDARLIELFHQHGIR